ncbi:MAG: cadherin repeat domain-containing protein [Myxococcota bacterium]
MATPAAPLPSLPPPDVSVSAIGVQSWTDSATAPTNVDLLVSERLRWTLAGDVTEPGTDVAALVDGRFTFDLGSGETPLIEWGTVRQAGLQVTTDRWTVDLGRSPVYRGGPRLVDGFQARYSASDTVEVGVWGGLEPDLFTTVPRVRPGGGPVIAYATSNVQWSAVGEVAASDTGDIDRLALLTMGRFALERQLDLSGRLDVEVGDEGPRLVDGLVSAVAHPAPSVRIDAMYDAFGSYKYLTTELLDPRLTRFVQREIAAGAIPDLVEDVRDPTINQLVGGGLRFQPDTDGVAPRVGVSARYRLAPEATDRYFRINPQVGVVRVADTLDLIADVNYIDAGPSIDAFTGQELPGAQLDGGLLVYVEPPDAAVSVDASARVVIAPNAYDGPGWYSDLFLNVVSPPLDLLFIAGGTVSSEPDPLYEGDLGFGLFVRMAKYLRPSR